MIKAKRKCGIILKIDCKATIVLVICVNYKLALTMVAQRLKCLPGMKGDQGSIPGSGRSPGERNGNPLCTLAWRIPWREEPGRLQSMGLQGVGHDMTEELHFYFHFHGHLPSISTRIKSRAPAAADFQHPLKRVQGGEQKQAVCVWD